MFIVIENMEDGVSRWLIEEYLESIRVAREAGVEIVFTNIRDPSLKSILASEGALVYEVEGWRLFNRTDTIVLDPQAPRRLEPWEARMAYCIVVGGIMGDHPPRGRTLLISSMYTNSAKRNLGPNQLSIDGAVKVTLRIAKGARLDEIPLSKPPARLRVRTLMGEIQIELPYSYPLREDGTPDIAPGVVKLLERGIAWDESLEEGI